MILNCLTKPSFQEAKYLNNSRGWRLPGRYLGKKGTDIKMFGVSHLQMTIEISKFQPVHSLGPCCYLLPWLHTRRAIWMFCCIDIDSLSLPLSPCSASWSPVPSEIKYKFTVVVSITKIIPTWDCHLQQGQFLFLCLIPNPPLLAKLYIGYTYSNK